MGTAAESKQQYITAMGEQLGIQYAELWQEIAHLNLTWLEFVELFGTKSSRIELLNHAAGGFFRIVQDRLWEAVALHIARLTDPPLSLGRQDRANLTLLNLPNLIDEPKISAEVRALCGKAQAASAFARDWRNRHIAHRDLDLALGGGAQALPLVSKNEVNGTLEAFGAVMNAVARHYLDSTTSFRHIARINGAEQLIYVINDGLEAAAAKQRRIEKGDFSDLRGPALDL